MDRRRSGIGLGVGLLITVIVAVALTQVLPAFSLAATVNDFSGAKAAWFWTGALGLVLGATALGGVRYSSLVSGVPAVLLFALFIPRLLVDPPVTPDWVPSFLEKVVYWGYDPMAALIIGVLLSATVWSIVDRSRGVRP